MPGYNMHNLPVNDSDVENLLGQYQGYPYHCDLPKPLLPPARLPRIVLNQEDPALELITLKKEVKNDVDRMKNYYSTHKDELEFIKTVKWRKSKHETNAKLPKYIHDLADLQNKDPDPHFEGVYNWYYTGGTVNYLQLNNKNILLFPFMGELVSTPLAPPAIPGDLWKPLLKQSAKCELDGTLYELKHNLINNTCMILGRFKWYCNFYILSEHDNKCNLTEIHKQNSSKTPYISGDLSPTNKDQYCLVTVDKRVSLWDITKTKVISRKTMSANTMSSDPWSSIKYQSSAEPDVLVFVDRCCLHYFDTRISLNHPMLIMCLKQHLDKCEQLSLDLPSRNNYCRYIGTNHSVLMCDKRSPKQCVQQKWTHQFKQTPIMGCTINRKDEEFVVLSNQVNRETTVILNTWGTDGDEFEETSHSYHFPYTPLDFNATLLEFQMKRRSLDPYLGDRFLLSNIGSALIKHDDNIYLFRQNSIGDIYYGCISYEAPVDSSINDKSYSTLASWEEALSVQTGTLVPLTMSNKTNMQRVFEAFTNNVLKYKECIPDDSYEPSWKQSIDKLSTYTDLLAPELLSVWDVSDDPLSLTTEPHEKVLNWLESASTEAPVLSQEDQENILTPINTQELISVSQEMDITYLDDSNALQDLLPKVKSTPKKRRKN